VLPSVGVYTEAREIQKYPEEQFPVGASSPSSWQYLPPGQICGSEDPVKNKLRYSTYKIEGLEDEAWIPLFLFISGFSTEPIWL